MAATSLLDRIFPPMPEGGIFGLINQIVLEGPSFVAGIFTKAFGASEDGPILGINAESISSTFAFLGKELGKTADSFGALKSFLSKDAPELAATGPVSTSGNAIKARVLETNTQQSPSMAVSADIYALLDVNNGKIGQLSPFAPGGKAPALAQGLA